MTAMGMAATTLGLRDGEALLVATATDSPLLKGGDKYENNDV
jgi:hypothetical protein